MKVALCLHGHFRVFDKCIENLFTNIINPYKPDIFMMAWVDSMGLHQHPATSHDPKNHPGFDLKSPQVNSNYLVWALASLAPVDAHFDHYYLYDQHFANMVEKYKEFHHPSQHHRPRGTLSLNYSRQIVMAMKQNHERNYNFKYDRVICTRYDVDHPKKILLEQLDPNVVTLPNIHGPHVTSDVWACGSSDHMNAWGEQISGIQELIEQKKFSLGTHEWMKAWFEYKNIPWQNADDLGIYTRR